ncbi:MAG: response regulator transcription factor [Caldilineaceae bacterium]
MSKIFIVEDHAIIRQGYMLLIHRAPDLEVCGEATTAEEALAQIAVCHPALVIADMSLPGLSGDEFVKALRLQYPQVKILVVSGHADESFAEGILAMGADGYLVKERAPQTLIDTIYQILS